MKILSDNPTRKQRHFVLVHNKIGGNNGIIEIETCVHPECRPSLRRRLSLPLGVSVPLRVFSTGLLHHLRHQQTDQFEHRHELQESVVEERGIE